MTSRNRIDVHSHVVPPFWAEQLDSYGGDHSGTMTPTWWSADGAIAFMDSLGIATSILSLTAPSIMGWMREVRMPDQAPGTGLLSDQSAVRALTLDDVRLTFVVDGARAIARAAGTFVNEDPLSCSPPGWSSTRPGVSWSASTPAAPSAGSSPRTSSA
jgi:hypothetical protein